MSSRVQRLLRAHNKGTKTRALGISLCILVILNILLHIFYEGRDLAEVFWFCNIATFYLAYGFYFRDAAPINATLAIAIPAQFLWIVDYAMFVFLDESLGRTAILMESSTTYIVALVSLIMHMITIPLAIFGTVKFGFTKRAYTWMLAIVFVLLPATYLFTSAIENRNCVFYPCDYTYAQYYDKFVLHDPSHSTLPYFAQYMFFWFILCTALFLVLHYMWRQFIKD